jgi:uridylate kinase
VISHNNKVYDFDYLREFRDLLQEQVVMGKKFVLITGGGQNCRDLLDVAREKGGITLDRDLHWIGAAVNTVNAQVVRGFLGDDLAEEHVWKFSDVHKLKEMRFEKAIAVAGGFEAGYSSDGVALKIAEAWGAKMIFDIKNVDGVYDSDPKQNPKAKFFPELDWQKYLDIIGNPDKHTPGGHFPVDAVTARRAQEINLEYRIVNANDLTNLENAITGEGFRGTIIN